jgi:hypothetical protein
MAGFAGIIWILPRVVPPPEVLQDTPSGRLQNSQLLRCAPWQYPDITGGTRLEFDYSATSESKVTYGTGH